MVVVSRVSSQRHTLISHGFRAKVRIEKLRIATIHSDLLPYKHAYEPIRTYYFIQKNFIPDEHLRTDFLLMNNFLQNFSIRTSVLTNFCRYKYFTSILYTIRTSAYELLRTYFFQTNFIPYEHLLTNNCVQTLCIQTISICTLVLESKPVEPKQKVSQRTLNVIRRQIEA